jgi:alpha-L-fucosidase
MNQSSILILSTLVLAGSAGPAFAVDPPAPCLPIPNAEQLAWQRDELTMFIHFGINQFTNREWGDGKEDPKIFNPTKLDTDQWIRAAKKAGFKLVILTTKHHDGFCLFPSKYTDHSVESSSWKKGRGDIVRRFVDSCRKYDIKVGFYLSPWDRHEPKYASNEAYDEYFRNQLTELLTNYGPVSEMWFDGAGGENPDGTKHAYDWPSYYAHVRKLQPKTLMAICGPDIRWVGNEDGVARETEWSVQERGGEKVWHPAECDVSIRPGWFWHEKQDSQVKSIDRLLDIYYKSVGRNSGLLLNVPPNDKGRFAKPDLARLKEFKAAIDEIYSVDFATGKAATASAVRGDAAAFGPANLLDDAFDTYWSTNDGVTTGSVEIDLGKPATFNVARTQEYIALGQRVEAYTIETWDGAAWKPLVSGTTIGHKKLDRFAAVTTQKVRLSITKARACPTISSLGLHHVAKTGLEDQAPGK